MHDVRLAEFSLESRGRHRRTRSKARGRLRSLEVLDLQSAKVSKLPASLATLPALREVNGRWTKVDARKARAMLPSQVKLVEQR